MGKLTSVLFAEPSFIEGMARALDIAGTLDEYNISPTGRQADAWALQADVRAIGFDMRQAVQRAAEKERRGA